jgi:hypothetical protein
MDLVATHQRLLIGAALRTNGPILELGCGWYSTPLLHEIAEAQKRLVVTADNNYDWLAQFQCLESENHKFQLVGWWGDFLRDFAMTLRCDWALCLCDQGQPIEREYAARKLIGSVRVFVFHDTEEGYAYGYDRVMPMFKHTYTDRCHRTWTTIASNSVDVSTWFKDLPPVEPSKEAT